ncbi:MAG: CbtB-domain containing protein [Dehalococcoidia bacterium]|nr:CbtB-domain containing protein [Dehalococcoidia bacterium]
MNTLATKSHSGFLGKASAFWPVLLAATAGLYLVALYQTEAVAAMVGQTGQTMNLLHEVFHDVRHAAGFMCH